MVHVDNRGGPGGPRGSNNTLYFIVGALVIAVLIIGWFMYGGDTVDEAVDVDVTTEEPATPAADVDTNVTVETPAAPATTEPPPATPEPAAPAPDDAAPATTEPAPAIEPAPATPPAAEPAPATPPAGGTTTTP